MKAEPGNYIGRIVEHGTNTSSSGLPLIQFDVKLVAKLGEDGAPRAFDGENVFCRSFLAGGTEEKTATAIRMTRATLKLCGFDPDARDLSDLDDVPTLLAGNEIPIRVSEREYNGKFFTNYDIALPRGITKDRSSSLTSALRAAKSDGEPEVKKTAKIAPAASRAPTVDPQAGSFRNPTAEQRAAVNRDAFEGESDLPF